ncbi:MAG: hypothetical protein CMJ83_01510 [Planctomycetes bacterium]|nr:hypothetical protein [Planctomycetota bacterium]
MNFPPNPRHPRLRESGNILAAVYLSIVPIIGVIAAFHLRTGVEMKIHQARKFEIRASQRAIAALEVARNQVLNSSYTSSNNDVLQAALTQVENSSLMSGDPYFGDGYVAFDVNTGRKVEIQTGTGLAANLRAYRHLVTIDLEDDLTGETDDATDKVSVYVVNLAGMWHMMEARATVGDVSRTARMLVRERDPFTRFSIFIDNHYQGIAGSPRGDIHTNQTLQLFFPDGNYDDFVSAKDGFEWLIGASLGNTSFNSGYAAPTAEIAMPSLNDIQGIQPFAAAPYYVDDTYDNVEIEFQGDQVVIKARKIATGLVETVHDGDLPPGGVIYAENSVIELGGDVNGRVTVASEGDVTITDSVRYVDGEGDPAMLNPNDPVNYMENPAYDGASAVGIIANGPVLYDHGIPSTFELHAAVFSSSGNVGLPGLTFTANGAYATGYDPSFQKQNLNILGATISDKRFVGTVVDWYGNILSGFQDGAIEYDRDLLNNPPPHFLEIDRPLFKGVEVLENLVDA